MAWSRFPNWNALWTWMTIDERQVAGEAFWRQTPKDDDERKRAVRHLADVCHFRKPSVRKLAPEKAARFLAIRGRPPENVTQAIVVAGHVHERLDVLTDLLDYLGVEHDSGMLADCEHDAVPRSESDLARAIEHVSAKHPERDVTNLLATLALQDGAPFVHISDVLDRSGPEPPPAADEAAADNTEPEDDPGVAPGTGFTTLDRVLIDTTIASVSEGVGALAEAELDDLIEETIHLNQKRHQSYFHRGFADGLVGRDLRLDDPELNRERRRWYLCGIVHSHARRDDRAAISKLWDAHRDDLHAMTSGNHPSCDMVARIVYRALTESHGVEEAAGALSPKSLLQVGPSLFSDLMSDGAAQIRRQKPESAAPLLNLALVATERLLDAGVTVPDGHVRELSRRLAQVDQLRGDFESAARQFQGLLDEEHNDVDFRGLVEADLAMARCHLRSLGGVRLPDDPQEWRSVATSLEPGEELLCSASGHGTARRAHAEYSLGILAFARERTDEALEHFESAVAEMSANRTVFEPLGVLPRARLYLGAALAECGDVARVDDVRDHLRAAAEGLAPNEGDAVFGRALEFLAILAPKVAAEVAATLHDEMERDVLDVAAQAGVLRRAPELLAALAKRAGRSKRSTRKRFADWRTVLRESLLCEPPETELAERALDQLEHLATTKDRSRALLKILGAPRNYSPAWDEDDAMFARVRLLAAQGKCAEAAALLLQHGHDVLTRDEEHGVVVAAGVLEQIAGYGIEGVDGSLASRCEATAGKYTDEMGERRAPPKGSIVFVGGNETQERCREWLTGHVREIAPGVKLALHFPGWSANWRARLDSFEKQLRKADVVVLSPYVRTNMGRTIRKICSEVDIPWVACTGTGRETMLACIRHGIKLIGKECNR